MATNTKTWSKSIALKICHYIKVTITLQSSDPLKLVFLNENVISDLI